MEIPATVIQQWEKRLPSLDETWTHWWLEGDACLLAVVPGSKLSEAVNVVKENHERFASIKAFRAKLDENGEPVRQEKRRAEICNYRNNRIWRERRSRNTKRKRG